MACEFNARFLIPNVPHTYHTSSTEKNEGEQVEKSLKRQYSFSIQIFNEGGCRDGRSATMMETRHGLTWSLHPFLAHREATMRNKMCM